MVITVIHLLPSFLLFFHHPFQLDEAKDWVTASNITEVSLLMAVDLEPVVVHGIRHLLGLGHSSVEDAIVYPMISARMRKVKLMDDNIVGVQQRSPSINSSHHEVPL